MSPESDKLRLSVVTEAPPAKRLRILVVAVDPTVKGALRKVFDQDETIALQIAPDTETATRMLADRRVDLVALDPAVAPGGFALLKHVKDRYRWTATLIATHNQDPEFLRQAIGNLERVPPETASVKA